MYRQLLIIIALSLCLSSIAQKKVTHSIAELRSLLQKSKADTSRINLLLKAGLLYVLKPGETKMDMDSALYFTNSALQLSNSLKAPEWIGRCHYVYSNIYRESKEIEKGKEHINKAIQAFTKYNLKSELGDAYIELANYYDPFEEKEYPLKINYHQQAEKLFEQTGEKEKQAGVLKNLGDFHQVWGHDSIAIEELHKALAIYQSINYPDVQGVYDLLGYAFYARRDYKQALKYNQLALQTAEKVKVGNSELSTIYNRIGLTYYQLLQYEQSADYFKRSFDLAMADRDTGNARIISHNVVNSYLRLKKQQEVISFLNNNKSIFASGTTFHKVTSAAAYIHAYLLTNEYRKAEPYVQQMQKAIVDNKEAGTWRSFRRAAIPYYVMAGQYKEAYKYFVPNEKLCRDNNLLPGLAENYLWWSRADSALGKKDDALAHYKLYKEASDSAQRMANDQQISQLLIEYETSKKDQEIAFNKKNIELLTNQATLQQSKLKQTRLVRNLTIGGIVLLLVIVSLLFNRYRLKQKSNAKLELQQIEINEKNNFLQNLNVKQEQLLVEKEWLLKEVHHRVKNNLQMVTSLLNTQAAYLESKEAVEAIRDSQHRMEAISLIHKKLYQSDDTGVADMLSYINELVNYLKESFDAGDHIRFVQDVQPMKLDVAHAVPLGLIINEAISNAIKYAFPAGRNGVIKISLEQNRLTIADNGIGLPPGFNIEKIHSLGMNMMKGLSKQLGCNFTMQNNNGVTITVEFNLKKQPNTEAFITLPDLSPEMTGHA